METKKPYWRFGNKTRLKLSTPRKKRKGKPAAWKINKEKAVAAAATSESAAKQEKLRLQQDGASTSADISAVEQGATGPNNQDLCAQIKNSLKKLRRLEAGEAESDEEKHTADEAPSLNMEVFSEETENTEEKIIKNNDADSDNDAEDEPSQLIVESRTKKVKSQIIKRVKPKRNPKRRVVVEQEVKKSIEAARSAPAVEKVFVNSIEKDDNPTKCSKKRSLEDTDLEYNQMEQLYEYGKYIAEQLMCFDEKDIQSAKTEINEVLTKYRLKYKIMNCLKPINGDAGANTNSVEKSPPPNTVRKLGTIIRPRVQPNPNTPKRVKKAATVQPNPPRLPAPQSITNQQSNQIPQVVSVVPSLNKLGIMQGGSTTGGPLGFVIVPNLNTTGFHITTQRVDATGNLVSQPVNLPGTSLIPPGASQISGPVNLSGSSKVVTGSVAIPAGTITQSGSSVGTLVSQPGSSSISSVNLPGQHPTSNILLGPLMALPNHLGLGNLRTEAQIIQQNSESTESVPSLAHVKIVESRTGTLQISPGGTLPQPISETSGPPFQMPQTHFISIIPSNMEPEQLIVKAEADSDEEGDTLN